MLNQSLQQRLQQKLSPQQIQVIKLLEIPTIELEERIRQEIEENPALEEGPEDISADDENEFEENPDSGNNDDIDLDEYMQDDDIPDYKLQANNTSKDDKREDIPFSVGMSFHEYLIEQLYQCDLNENDQQLAEYIIGNIDDEGYLRREIEAMTDDIAFQLGIEVSDKKMYDLLAVVQDFDPPGIAARNLQECLRLQIERREQTLNVSLATKIINECFEEFSKHHFEKIINKLSITETDLKAASSEIMKLNPKPGNAWGTIMERSMQQIIPDFIVEIENGEPVVSLNNKNIPELRISNVYKEMFSDYSCNKQNKAMKDAVLFVKQKLDSARFFIDAIKQRYNTLLVTMTAIAQFQREFFVKGDEVSLKPMILKDISDITGFDVSTISRVSNSKYAQTEFGIYPVKYFFSESMYTDSGEEVSSREIKSILQECINNENKKKPITDEQLAKILQQKGYIIARRTVAKYREQLDIPVARLRKEI